MARTVLSLIPALACALLASPASGQTVYLDEHFDGGVFPPTDWGEWNNGISLGWEGTASRATHADYFGANDNRLLSPSLDLTAASSLGLHVVHDQLFARYRDQNEVEVTLDGGLTYTTLVAIDTPFDGMELAIDLDLGAFAGQPDLRVSFRYVGDFANEWSIDQLRVDDQPPAIPPLWPELPTTFIPWEGYCERFDGLDGIVPPHIAINALDAASRQPDPEAWCNLGQQAPSAVSFSGIAALEMGLEPGSTNFHRVANALIFGFDGAGLQNTAFEMMVWQSGEELDADDGVFVSVDGLDWVPLRTDWERMTGGSQYLREWRRVGGDLASSGLNLNGNFYLAIAQSDDFPFGSQDGVAIDDFCGGGAVVPLHFQITNLSGGALAQLKVTGLDRDAFCSFLYSLAGSGPTQTPYGLADIGSPYYTLATMDADRNGEAVLDVFVPTSLVGRTVWAQAVEILGASGRFSNSLMEVIQ